MTKKSSLGALTLLVGSSDL